NTVVLTQRFAKLFFPSKHALGRTLTLGGNHVVKVTGVVKNPPPNTNIPFNLFEHFSIRKSERTWHEVSDEAQFYFTLKKGVSAAAVQKRLPRFAKHFGKDADTHHLILQPLLDIHYNNQYENFNYQAISKTS